ncbi:putative serine esterase [Hirsutella rhossiliensis]|uniref:Serine esterase n=1 Tax=Hirsutella rhossiliensis TaxID=111463 RepID=A0A9P8N5I2_9HYPO|nr:putative serine esterase [Hirsutella rhossiliensis]KAH0966326.1 putative serine esterase [Hirsutella rhossiliensis]
MTGWTGVVAAVALVLAAVTLGPIVAKLRQRRQSPRPEGIQIISDPLDAKILAFHGLGAHPEHTDDFPEARIVSFAHNSDWLIDAPVKTAQTIGHRLLDKLAEHRSGRPRVPIVFIGHSFGGIIVKEALCKPGDATREVADSICGIIFLGTPHIGSV